MLRVRLADRDEFRSSVTQSVASRCTPLFSADRPFPDHALSSLFMFAGNLLARVIHLWHRRLPVSTCWRDRDFSICLGKVPTMAKSQPSGSRRPEKVFRIGYVTASVFAHEVQNGDRRPSVVEL